MDNTMSAYSEKLKEMSMLSLLCSCLYSKPQHQTISHFEDMEVKFQNKQTSGQSFEIILNSPTDLSPDKPQSLNLTSDRKEPSLENLQKKLDAAEERRRSLEKQFLKQLSEKQEHVREVINKVNEDNHNYSRMVEEKLNHKMEVSSENRIAHLSALKQRLIEKKIHATAVRRNKELRSGVSK